MIHYISRSSTAIIIEQTLSEEEAVELFKALPWCNVIHEFEVVPWARMWDREPLTERKLLPMVYPYELSKLKKAFISFNHTQQQAVPMERFISLLQDPNFYCKYAAGIDMLCFPAPKNLVQV